MTWLHILGAEGALLALAFWLWRSTFSEWVKTSLRYPLTDGLLGSFTGVIFIGHVFCYTLPLHLVREHSVLTWTCIITGMVCMNSIWVVMKWPDTFPVRYNPYVWHGLVFAGLVLMPSFLFFCSHFRPWLIIPLMANSIMLAYSVYWPLMALMIGVGWPAAYGLSLAAGFEGIPPSEYAFISSLLGSALSVLTLLMVVWAKHKQRDLAAAIEAFDLHIEQATAERAYFKEEMALTAKRFENDLARVVTLQIHVMAQMQIIYGDYTSMGEVEKEEFIHGLNDRSRHAFNWAMSMVDFDMPEGPLPLCTLQLDHLVRQRVDKFRQDACCPASLVINVISEPLKVYANPDLLGVVVDNLVFNSMIYCQATPIDVRVFSKDGQPCVSFRDGGMGIPVWEMENIFKPVEAQAWFRKIRGLGIYMTQQRAALMGGDLSATAKPGDITFTLTLAPPPEL